MHSKSFPCYHAKCRKSQTFICFLQNVHVKINKKVELLKRIINLCGNILTIRSSRSQRRTGHDVLEQRDKDAKFTKSLATMTTVISLHSSDIFANENENENEKYF